VQALVAQPVESIALAGFFPQAFPIENDYAGAAVTDQRGRLKLVGSCSPHLTDSYILETMRLDLDFDGVTPNSVSNALALIEQGPLTRPVRCA
jgi:hypothetical protein